MPTFVKSARLAQAAALMLGALSLSACASGSGMFVSGNDGGPSSDGFFEEDAFEEAEVDEQVTGDDIMTESAGLATERPYLIASGNSLLPLPSSLGATRGLSPSGSPLGALGGLITPGAVTASPQVAAALGPVSAGLAATVGTGSPVSAAIGASVGLPGGTPLAGVQANANLAAPAVEVSLARQPLVGVNGSGVTLLGASATGALASPLPVAATPVAAANALVSGVAGVVTARDASRGTSSPMSSMTPGTAPLSAVVSRLGNPLGL